MTPLALDMEGFRTYSQPTHFDFPSEHGLFQLCGANGSGKSTIWDAICWVLMGKTMRGVKGPSIVSWGKKTARGSLLFKIHGKNYVVERTQSPNNLVMGLVRGKMTNVTQEALEEFLGFGYEAFLHGVVFGQFNTFFFDLVPTEKLRVFGECLKLEVWESARKRAADKARETQDDINQVTTDIQIKQGQLQEIADQLDVRQAAKEVEQLEKECDRLAKEERQVKKELGALAVTLAETKTKLTASSTLVTEAERRVEVRQMTTKDKVIRFTELRSQVGAAEANLKKLVDQIAKVKDVEGSECPLCKSEVSHEHVGSVVAKLTKEMTTAKKNITDLKDDRDKLEKDVHDSEERLEELREALRDTVSEQDQLRRSLNKLQLEKNDLEHRAESLHSRQGELSISVVDLRGRADKMAKRKEELDGQIEALAADASKYKLRLGRYEYWAEQFKQVRLWVVDSALEELRVMTNTYLEQLGLINWQVLFSVDRPKKDGGVIRGFSVSIACPASKGEPVPWECWSGGETQRLRLAGAAAVSMLIRTRLGIDSAFEVWDEPSQFIEVEGIDMMLDFFSSRAGKLKRTVWLVDHRSLHHGRFSGSYEVIKRQGTSTLKQVH